ncbi:MAG: signal peptidase I [Oscillospiraceae bacterium]|nr:signal peptidase I [Oscillospiraceae bacterium]
MYRYSFKVRNNNNPVVLYIYGIFQMLLYALIAFAIIFCFFFRLVTVDGNSMTDTLLNGDKLIVSELFTKPKCGDIIVANSNDTLGKIIVKRVIASEGQSLKIDYDKNEVAVDGVILDEAYTSSKTSKPTDYWKIPYIVPEGYVFVMGDNRAYSLDSRDNRLQLVAIDDIVGKAEFIISPFDRVKYLY